MGSELPTAQTALLDLDESKVPRRRSLYPKIDEFTVFAKETFRKYKQSDQRIDTFRLCLKSEWYGLSGLAAKWTSKALKLGATDLTFRLIQSRIDQYPAIFIPFDEVFGTQQVVTLSLDKLRVYQRLDVTKCSSRLKSLTLTDVSLSAESFFNILSSCPLIENLSLSNIGNYGEYYGENGCEGVRKVERIPKGSTIGLPKLTSLVLSRVGEPEIQNLFVGDSSSNFPNLKELTLCLRLGNENEPCFISIHSLEILNFTFYNSSYYDSEQDKSRRSVEFDVPSIRKFTFKGSNFPNVSFRSTSMDQLEESRVGLTRHGALSATWFRELSDFLKQLSPSKIHLCLHWHFKDSFDYQAGEINEGFDLVELENLTMDTKGLPCLSFNALLDGLFRICRPKMITQYASSRNNNDTFLCRALSGEGVQGKRLFMIISQFMLRLLDLEEVKAQKLFDEGWIWQPLNSILGDSKRRFRFLLKWKPLEIKITT